MPYWIKATPYDDPPFTVEMIGYQSSHEMVLRSFNINPFEELDTEDGLRVMYLAIDRKDQDKNLLLDFVKQVFTDFVIHVHTPTLTRARITVEDKSRERLKFIFSTATPRFGLTEANSAAPGPLKGGVPANAKRRRLIREIIANEPLKE